MRESKLGTVLRSRPTTIEALLLTHVHIDHSGLIPKFVREGFSGPILGHASDCRSCRYRAARLGSYSRRRCRLQERDDIYAKAVKARPLKEPLYTMSDVERRCRFFKAWTMTRPMPVAEGIDVIFRRCRPHLGLGHARSARHRKRYAAADCLLRRYRSTRKAADSAIRRSSNKPIT